MAALLLLGTVFVVGGTVGGWFSGDKDATNNEVFPPSTPQEEDYSVRFEFERLRPQTADKCP